MKRTYIATTQEAKALHDGTQTAIIAKIRVQPKDCSHIHRITDELCEWRNEPQRMDTYGNYIACSFCGYGIEISGEYMFPIPYAIGQEVVVRETWYTGYVLDDNDDIPDGAPLQHWYYADTKDSRPSDMSDSYCYHLWGDNKECWPRWQSPATMPVSAARTRFIPVSCEAVRVREMDWHMCKATPIETPEECQQYIKGKLGQSAWDNNDYIFYYKIEKI